MRIELKDENQEEPQKIDENDIRYKHETDLTKKEKRELEKMKLASMGWKGKLQYIWAYYKPQMAAIVAVIAIAFFVKDLYENSRIHTALTVMVIDSYGTKQEEAEEKVQKALGIQDDPVTPCYPCKKRTSQISSCSIWKNFSLFKYRWNKDYDGKQKIHPSCLCERPCKKRRKGWRNHIFFRSEGAWSHTGHIF